MKMDATDRQHPYTHLWLSIIFVSIIMNTYILNNTLPQSLLPPLPLFLLSKHRCPSHDPSPLLPVLASVLFVHRPLLPLFYGAASPYHRGGEKRGGSEEAKGER